MFDGDVDRIGFVTNEGEVINCDIITSIIANQILKKDK
jgi:phosphomannomutase